MDNSGANFIIVLVIINYHWPTNTEKKKHAASWVSLMHLVSHWCTEITALLNTYIFALTTSPYIELLS